MKRKEFILFKKALFYSLLFLFCFSSLFLLQAQEDDRSWYDPEKLGFDPGYPDFYDEYKTAMSDDDLQQNSVFTDRGSYIDNNAIEIVFIIVENSIYTAIEADLSVYIANINNDYNIYVYSNQYGFGNPQSFRQNILTKIDGLTQGSRDGFKGCIFVGKLPSAWYQYDNIDFERKYTERGTTTRYVEFPCDLFFMDFDATWSDNNTYPDWRYGPPLPVEGTPDGIFDSYDDSAGSIVPEIWIGRIFKGIMVNDKLESDINEIRQYLNTKNDTYRDASVSAKVGALYYSDEETTINSDMGDFFNGALGGGIPFEEIPAPTANPETPTAKSENYKTTIEQTDYEFVQIDVRSCSRAHDFGDKSTFKDPISGSDLPIENTPDKKTRIYSFLGSSTNRYTAPDNIGSMYLFSPDNGALAILGSTKSGGLTNKTTPFFDSFYNGNGMCLGDALINWMKTIYNDNSEPTSDPPVPAHYTGPDLRMLMGMTIQGDPTIKQIGLNKAQEARLKGITFFLENTQFAQQENGSWSNDPTASSFVALCLLNEGYVYDKSSIIAGDIAVTKAIDYLILEMERSFSNGIPRTFTDDYYGTLEYAYMDYGSSHNTYHTGSAILPIAVAAPAVTDAGDRGRLLDALEYMRNFFLIIQLDSGHLFNHYSYQPFEEGGFGYGATSPRPDNSNVQFALMGLSIAQETLKNERPEACGGLLDNLQHTYDACVTKWLQATQFNNTGIHLYHPNYVSGNSPVGDYHKCMTAAALWSYALCNYPTWDLNEDTGEPNNHYVADAIAAYDWLEDSFTNNFEYIYAGEYKRYYFTLTLSKALMMNKKKIFGNLTSWYDTMCDYLIDGLDFNGNSVFPKQNADGSWSGYTDRYRHLLTAWNINTIQIYADRSDLINPNAPEYKAVFTLNSFSDLHVYDDNGRHVGINYEKKVVDMEIPGSNYVLLEKQSDDTYKVVQYSDFENGIIPPTGVTQVIILKKAKPTTFLTKLKGTGNGDYKLDVRLDKGETEITSKTYTGTIIDEQDLQCVQNYVNLTGPKVYFEPMVKAPVWSLHENDDEPLVSIERTVKPSTNLNFEFEIHEKAGVPLESISVACSSIIGTNGVKISNVDHMSFTVGTPQQQDSVTIIPVYGTIKIPAGFEGPGDGYISVAAINGGSKPAVKITLRTNEPPVAVAGIDQLIYAGASTNFEATVTLDGSDSYDPDEDEITFTWYNENDVEISITTGVTPEITLGLGIHRIMLCVEDSKGEKDWDDVTIQVLNRAPTAVAGEDISVFGGAYGLPEAKVTLDGTASTDPESDPLIYNWYEEDVLIATGPTPEVILAAGIHTISLIVDDTVNISEPDEVTVTVIEAIPATMWIWPNRININGCYGLVNTTITLPVEIKREDVDDDFRIQLFTKDGESIDSFYDRIFPYMNQHQQNKDNDKNTKKLVGNEKLRCYVEKLKKVKIISVFFKRYLIDLLKETGEYTLYAVGRLKSGEYFNAATQITLYDRYYYYYHHNHHK